MDIWFDIALIAHLFALMAAGAVLVAMPLIARRMATATPETRGSLAGVAQGIGMGSRVALVVLLISGPLMLWLRYGGIEGASFWFWVKMVLIVTLIIGMGAGDVFRRRMQAGDRSVAGLAQAATWLSRISLVGIVVAAVLAFN
jgi:hypothetical protein